MSSSLPIDIIQSIVSSSWSTNLSPAQRASFMKSSLLVSKTWQSVFLRVAATDCYVLGPSRGSIFLEIIRRKDLHTLCRSITIQHENKYLLPGPDSQDKQPIGFIIRDILHELQVHTFPSLRRISIQLKNYLMETVFEGNNSLFSSFPNQVRELDIHFTYGEDTDPLVVMAIKSREYERFGLKAPNGSELGVRRLEVFGTSSGVAKELLSVFGGRERLESFEQDAWEDDLDDDDDEDQFFDCETELEPATRHGYEKLLVNSFSKEDLSHILSPLRVTSHHKVLYI